MSGRAELLNLRLGLVPTLAVMLLWPGIWLLWLTVPMGASVRTRVAVPDIRHVMAATGAGRRGWQPYAIALPWEAGLAPDTKIGDAHDMMVARRQLPPALLQREPLSVPGPAVIGSVSEGVALPPQVPYAPRLDVESPLPVAKLAPREARAGYPGGALRAVGFELPRGEPMPSHAAGAARLDAYVTLGERGLVQGVLLTQPSGITELDNAVVRWLHRGRGRGAASGNVRVDIEDAARSEDAAVAPEE